MCTGNASLMAELLGQTITKAETNNWTKDNVSNLANYSLLDMVF